MNLNGGTLTTGGNNATTTFSGTLGRAAEPRASTKTGTGASAWPSPAPTTSPGAVTIDAGALVENGMLATSVNPVTVDNAGILGGTGTLNRPLDVKSGGTVSPGDSGSSLSADPTTIATGILTTGTGGVVHFFPGSTFFVDLASSGPGQPVAGTDYDQLLVNGGAPPNVNFSGTVTLAGTSGTNPIGSRFTIIDNDTDSDSAQSLLNTTPEGGFVTVGTSVYNITYHGDDGNNAVLTLPGRFDFNATNAPTNPAITDTADGYRQVIPSNIKTTAATGPAFGWATAPLAFDRGASAAARHHPTHLQRAAPRRPLRHCQHLHGRPGQPRCLPGHPHHRRCQRHPRQHPGDPNGVVQPGLLTPSAGQFRSATFLLDTASTTTPKTLVLGLKDMGGTDPNFVLDALDIRPAAMGTSSVSQIRFTRDPGTEATSPLNNGTFPTPLDANGLTQDVYTGTGRRQQPGHRPGQHRHPHAQLHPRRRRLSTLRRRTPVPCMPTSR